MKRGLIYVIGYLVLYATALFLMPAGEDFSVVEALMTLVLMGGGFTFIAWLLTRKAVPLSAEAPQRLPLLALFLIFITCLVTWGFGFMPTAQPLRDLMMMAVKLAAFVLVPWLLFRQPLGARMNRSDLTITVLMALVLILFQAAFGQGFARIHEAGMPAARLTISFVFAFVWLALEAGLVEEYTFRAVLQTRLENALGTKTGGIVITALLFGLIHAPGLYLRAAHTDESLGGAPSLLTAIGYSIVILSPTGFFLGVLWSRTKNLAIVVLVHAATDLIPNVVELAKHFRIG